jgi:hypothetical protein
VCAVTIIGCSADQSTAPAVDGDPATVFSATRLDRHSINLTPAPYDTITVHAVPFNGLGDTLSVLGATLRFESSDTVAFSVDANGLVRAKKVDVAAWIIASIRIGQVTQVDSARVVSLSTTPVITGLSAVPVLPDTAKIAATRSKLVRVALSGANLAGTAVYFEIADSTAAYFGTSSAWNRRLGVTATSSSAGAVTTSITGRRPGKIMVRVSTTVAGVTWTDSVLYTVGVKSYASYSFMKHTRIDGTAEYAASPDTAYMMVGGTVTWNTVTAPAIPISIIFEDSSKARPSTGVSASSGNIEQFVYDPKNYTSLSRSRVFVRPDTIRWQCPELNTEGTLIVVDERACMPDCPPFP